MTASAFDSCLTPCRRRGSEKSLRRSTASADDSCRTTSRRGGSEKSLRRSNASADDSYWTHSRRGGSERSLRSSLTSIHQGSFEESLRRSLTSIQKSQRPRLSAEELPPPPLSVDEAPPSPVGADGARKSNKSKQSKSKSSKQSKLEQGGSTVASAPSKQSQFEKRRATVSLAPLSPCSVDETPVAQDGDAERRMEDQYKEQRRGYRDDYFLGDILRSTSHMVVEPTSEQAVASVGLLEPHDFAFLKRSDGSYTYAILAHRFKEGRGERCLTFVVKGDGSTKTAREGRWAECVRPVRRQSEFELLD